jgi:phosphate/sulfate permease
LEQESEAAIESANNVASLEAGSTEEDMKKVGTEKSDNMLTAELTSRETSSDPTNSVEEEEADGYVTPMTRKAKFGKLCKDFADKTWNRDLETEAMAMDDGAADIWDKAEVYDAKSEVLYSYLQVFTACALSFAHGSNDVANAIAPICAILAIYETGALSSKAPVPRWVLVMGAFGIVVGLALFGYKVIISIGFRLTKLSPSRGFAIQLSTSFVVVLASYLGIPVSTTQSTIGGTIGVGAVEGVGGVQWMFMLNVFLGWVGSFFITCLSSAGIMAFCYYSPSSGAFYEVGSVVNATVNSTAV